VTVILSLDEQTPSVTVKTYVVLKLGETVIEAVVSPVLHKYVPLPVPVSTAESPRQIVISDPASTLKAEMVMTNVTVSFMLHDDESVAIKLPLNIPAEA
jgi:hypothetical protein